MGKKAVGGSRPVTCAGGVIKWQPRVSGEAIAGELFDTRDESEKFRLAWLEIRDAKEAEETEQPKGKAAVVLVRSFAEDIYFAPREGTKKDHDNEKSLWRTYFGPFKADLKHARSNPGAFVHKDQCAFIDWPIHKVGFEEVQDHVNKIAKQESLEAQTIGRVAGENKQIVLTGSGQLRKPKTIRNAIGLGRRIWELALARGKSTKVLSNPWANKELKIPTEKAEVLVDTWTYLTLEEIDLVFKALPCASEMPIKPTKDRKLRLRLMRARVEAAKRRAFFAVAIYVGLRKGEICGLRWDHVVLGTFVHGVLKGAVPHLVIRYSYDGPPKTKNANREPRLFPFVQKALSVYREELDDLNRALGRIARHDELVFPSDHGGCYSKSWDYQWSDRSYRKHRGGPLITVKGLRSRAGIRAEVNFHCAGRHTCASMLMMGGFGNEPFKLETLMGWLGHSDLSVTQRYAHFVPSMLDASMAKLYEFAPPKHAVGDDD